MDCVVPIIEYHDRAIPYRMAVYATAGIVKRSMIGWYIWRTKLWKFPSVVVRRVNRCRYVFRGVFRLGNCATETTPCNGEPATGSPFLSSDASFCVPFGGKSSVAKTCNPLTTDTKTYFVSSYANMKSSRLTTLSLSF